MNKSLIGNRPILNIFLAITFTAAVTYPAFEIVKISNDQISALQKAYDIDDVKNVAAAQVPIILKKILQEVLKEHHVLGHVIGTPLIDGTADYLHTNLGLPSADDARQQLAAIPTIMNEMNERGRLKAVWITLFWASCCAYLSLSLWVNKENAAIALIFILTVLSTVFFAVGISAPAILIAVFSPKMNDLPSFVLHDDVRSVVGVIANLYQSNNWFVGLCLTICSLIIPLIKAITIFLAVGTHSSSLRKKIGRFLHLLSKWSMVDVFVAAIILATFALRSQPGTQVQLIDGFYYFFGYCLLSLIAGTLLDWKLSTD